MTQKMSHKIITINVIDMNQCAFESLLHKLSNAHKIIIVQHFLGNLWRFHFNIHFSGWYSLQELLFFQNLKF